MQNQSSSASVLERGRDLAARRHEAWPPDLLLEGSFITDLTRQNTTFQKNVSAAEPLPKHARSPFLEKTSGGNDNTRVELNKDQLVFGRGADVDIPLTDKRVSRKHAVLRRQNQEYSILDLDSMNGVYLNGLKVHSAILRNEDVIRVGDEFFTYYEG